MFDDTWLPKPELHVSVTSTDDLELRAIRKAIEKCGYDAITHSYEYKELYPSPPLSLYTIHEGARHRSNQAVCYHTANKTNPLLNLSIGIELGFDRSAGPTMLFLVVALREIGVSKMFYGHASFEINQALSNELYAHSIYNDEEALTLFEAYRAVKPIKLVMPINVSELVTQLSHSIYDYETLLIHAICGAMILYKTNC